jgi:phosphatidylinositol glycan class A protein
MVHRIAMVCDFFYPRHGGVEMHIWSLAQCLMQRGHKVIVITHSYGGRKGIRYMTNGLKVYYTPIVPFVDQNSFPTSIAMFPLFRKILIRERIDIVHGHQATSTMMHEATVQARTMGYKVSIAAAAACKSA